MDISQIFKAVFVALLLFSFMFFISGAYQHYQTSAELATLGDASAAIATELALDKLAFEDQAGRHAYIVDPMRFVEIESFSRILGGGNYEFRYELRYRKWGEVVLGPRGATLPQGRTSVSLVVPVVVNENARLVEGKLKVVTWRA